MWWKIAQKEFSLNLFSARFNISLLLCLMLIPITIVISLGQYGKRVGTYQVDKENAENELKQARVYTAVKPLLVFPPQPLSILCQGISNQMGHSVRIKVDEKPLLAEGSSNGSDNPLLMSFFYFDFVHILAILISLLALVFSYDLFSGERENGTLKLVFSNAVSRSTVVAGKISGVFITLVPILILCYLISIIIILMSPQVSFSATDWLGVIILFLASIFFMALFIGIGILVSVKSKSSFNGIVVSFFVWLWFLFLWPNISVYASQSFIKIQMLDQLQQSLRVFDDEQEKKTQELRKNLPGLGMFWNAAAGNDGYLEIVGSAFTAIDDQRKLQEKCGPLRLDYAQKKWQLQEVYLAKLERQERIARYLSFLSPSELFNHLCSVICHTDAESDKKIMENSRDYRDLLMSYFVRNKIFSSLIFFTPQRENEFFRTWDDLITFVTGGECKSWNDVFEWGKTHGGSSNVVYKVDYPQGKFTYYKPLDLSDLPKFNQGETNFRDFMPVVITETGVLLCLFIVLFSLIFNVCIRYDVR
jgi:ABC-type transport system involved in multi-copper enzyme maturation permease subunit